MNDGFTPQAIQSIGFYKARLSELSLEDASVSKELTGLKARGIFYRRRHSDRIDALEKRKQEITAERKKILTEVETMTRSTHKTEATQKYNECVGHAYGVAVYVDSDGKLLYEAVQPDVVNIGDTALEDGLTPFDTLPQAEQDMILRELKDADGTPEWFKNRGI